MLDWIAEKIGGYEYDNSDSKHKRRELQFDEDLIPWAEAELTKILDPRKTAVDIPDLVDDLLRFHMNAVGQKRMRTLLHEKCDLFEQDAYKKEAIVNCTRFIPRLFLEANLMKERKEKERKQRIKSRWSKAGMAAKLKIEKRFVHEAPLVECRPAMAKKDRVATNTSSNNPDIDMGIRRPLVQPWQAGEDRSESPVSCVTEIVQHARRRWQGQSMASTAPLQNLLPTKQNSALPLLKTRRVKDPVKQQGGFGSMWPQQAEHPLDSSMYLIQKKGTLPRLHVRTPSPELEDLDPDEDAVPCPWKELSLTERATFNARQKAYEEAIAKATRKAEKKAARQEFLCNE